METNSISIIKEVRTKEDLRSLQIGLEELALNIYGTGEKAWEKILENALPERFSAALLKLLGELPPEERLTKFKEILPELKNKIAQMRVLKIDLAFEPTGEFLEDLNQWIDQELGLEVVLDVGYEKALLGGARMALDGKYGDFSAARLLENILLDEKEKILQELIGKPH